MPESDPVAVVVPVSLTKCDVTPPLEMTAVCCYCYSVTIPRAHPDAFDAKP